MEIKKRKIYHCSTIEDALSFLAECDRTGFVFDDGSRIEGIPKWNFKDKTCYKTNDGKISVINIERVVGRDIVEYKTSDEILVAYKIKNYFSSLVLSRHLTDFGYKPKKNNGDVEKTIKFKDILRCNPVLRSLCGDTDYYVVLYNDLTASIATSDFVSRNNIKAIDDFYSNMLIGRKISTGEYVDCWVSSINGEYVKAVSADGRMRTIDVRDIIAVCEFSPVLSVRKGDVLEGYGYKYIVTEDSNGTFFKATKWYRWYDEPMPMVTINSAPSSTYPAIKGLDKLDKINAKAGQYIISKQDGNYFKVIEVNGATLVASSVEDGERYMFHEGCIEAILGACNIYSCEKPRGLVLEDKEDIDKLIDTALAVLEEHGYYDASRSGVRKIIDEWNKNKYPLALMLRKSPDWDEDNLCITRNASEERTTTYSAVSNRLYALYTGATTNYVGSLNDKYDLTSILSTIYNNINSTDPSVVSPTLRIALKDTITRCYNSNIRISCNSGMKLSKLVRDVCAKFEVSYFDYERDFARFSDSCATTAIATTYTLSINPIDYLLMSNGNSWSSCHYIDAGNTDKCYQAGTLSYLMDGCSMIFTTIAGHHKGEKKLALLEKRNRQMFMYSEGAILQSRLYPDCTNKILGITVWDFVKDQINICKGVDIAYVEREQDAVNRFFKTAYNSLHYPDYEYSCYNIVVHENVSTDYDVFPREAIGHEGICVDCGSTSDIHDDLRCYDCKECYDEDDY